MKNIKETLEQIKEVRDWSFYVNKEWFMGHAQVMYPTLGDREIESVWRIWEHVSAFNLYQLEDKSEALILTAMKIAQTVYDSVCKGAHVTGMIILRKLINGECATDMGRTGRSCR